MAEQDWDSVTVIGKRTNRAVATKNNAQLNEARRTGGVIATDKKTVGNKAHGNPDHQQIAALDRNDEVKAPPKLDMAVGKIISQARQAANLKQDELAKKINESRNVINDYEMGRVIPNQAILAKMERHLNVRLRGQHIGEPFPKKK